MPKPNPSRCLSITIERSFNDAYEFLRQPLNFSRWASGLANSLHQVDGRWMAGTPEGPMEVRFSAPNAFGVLDHWVYPASGAPIYIPLRLIENGSGCELSLTLFHLPHMTEEKFAADAEWVMKDLKAAKQVLEGG